MFFKTIMSTHGTCMFTNQNGGVFYAINDPDQDKKDCPTQNVLEDNMHGNACRHLL